MKSIREQSEQNLFSIAAIMAKTGQQKQEQQNGKTVHFTCVVIPDFDKEY